MVMPAAIGAGLALLILRTQDGREIVLPLDGKQQIPIPLPVLIQPDPLAKPSPSVVLYQRKSFSLTTARVNEEVRVAGDYLLAYSDGDYTDLQITLNAPGNDAIRLNEMNPIPGPFNTLFLTHSAQAGRTLALYVLRNVAVGFPMNPPDISATVLAPVPKFLRLRSDKDSHFTGALATNAKEDESLTGLPSNKIVIKRVILQADQNLSYALLFWATDGFDNTDLDLDTFLGEVSVDLAAIGRRPGGANQYYADLEVNVEYQDDDGTRELHVSLMNLDATSKNAGATGEVVAEFVYQEAQ